MLADKGYSESNLQQNAETMAVLVGKSYEKNYPGDILKMREVFVSWEVEVQEGLAATGFHHHATFYRVAHGLLLFDDWYSPAVTVLALIGVGLVLFWDIFLKHCPRVLYHFRLGNPVQVHY